MLQSWKLDGEYMEACKCKSACLACFLVVRQKGSNIIPRAKEIACASVRQASAKTQSVAGSNESEVMSSNPPLTGTPATRRYAINRQLPRLWVWRTLSGCNGSAPDKASLSGLRHSLGRNRAIISGIIAVLTTICWWSLIAASGATQSSGIHRHETQPFLVAVAMWAPMMAPAALPSLTAFAAMANRRRTRGNPRLLPAPAFAS